MTATILVSGAASTVGGLVVQELAKSGARVRAGIHRHRPSWEPTAGVESVAFDFWDRAAMRDALTGIEGVVLITPEVADMAEMTAALTDVAREQGVGRIVKLSFLNAEVGLGGPIVGWHREAEEVLADSGVPSTFLRANSFMQNVISFHSEGIVTGVLSSPLAEGRVSYVDARDVARAAATVVLGHGNREYYCLTGPEALSHEEIAAILSSSLGRHVRYRESAEADMREAMARRGKSGETLDALSELWKSMRRDAFAAVYPHFKELTGTEPITFGRFVQDYRQAFRLHPPRECGEE